MLKQLSFTALVLFCGCSSRHSTPATPAAAVTLSLTPTGAAGTVEDDSTDPTLACSDLRAFPVHGDTSEAFSNLTTAPTDQTRALLVGYGAPGTICTGRSSQCNTVTTAMDLPDVDDWMDSAHLIQGKFSKLTVLACNVGESPEGPDFVSRLANETKTPVRAPTGLVWCLGDSLTVEPGTQWVEARPGRHARAMPGPVHIVPILNTYTLYLNGELKDVPASAVRTVQFQYIGFPPYGSGKADPDQAKPFVQLLDLAHPFKKSARPLAAVTARIQFSVSIAGSQPIVKNYNLYADAVLRDTETKDLFYPVDSRFHERLQNFRLQNLRPLKR